MTTQDENTSKIFAKQITNDFETTITSFDILARNEKGDYVQKFIENHNLDSGAHSGIIGVLNAKNNSQDVEIAKKANISSLSSVATSGAYSDLTGKPDLATVATSGSYNDLSNKPTIPAAQVNSDWNASSGVAKILNKPTLATVATSGSYNDLSNKPTIPAAQVNSDWNASSGVAKILNKPTLATVATSGSYNDLSNKPSIPSKTSDLTNDSGFLTLGDISNVSSHALKSYEDAGELLTDAEGLADVTYYAHSTFDSSKFTANGTATITNGVASNFGGTGLNGFVRTANTVSYGSTFELYLKINTGTIISSNKNILATNNVQGIIILTGNGKLRIQLGNGTQWVSDVLVASGTVTSNTDYYLKFTYDETEYALYVLENGTWTKEISYASATQFLPDGYALNFGGSRGGTGEFLGSIDLKYFKLINNGAVALTGNQTGTDTYTIGGSTVSVPYSLSKTGSKVADSAYRTQVASVYNEFGFAPYYTLNEGTNFTLPQGEIYGIIEKKTDIDITGKLEKDLSNLPQSSKNTIIAWSIPDYSTLVHVPLSLFPYTVPYDCICYVYLNSGHNGRFWINNNEFSNQGVMMNFLLKANDEITADADAGYYVVVDIVKLSGVSGTPDVTGETNSAGIYSN